jgi:hypothetical protein
VCKPSSRRRYSTFLSEQTSHQQPANSIFLSKQISTSHQPPTKRRSSPNAGFMQFVAAHLTSTTRALTKRMPGMPDGHGGRTNGTVRRQYVVGFQFRHAVLDLFALLHPFAGPLKSEHSSFRKKKERNRNFFQIQASLCH